MQKSTHWRENAVFSRLDGPNLAEHYAVVSAKVRAWSRRSSSGRKQLGYRCSYSRVQRITSRGQKQEYFSTRNRLALELVFFDGHGGDCVGRVTNEYT